MKKPKIFIACDTSSVSRLRKIITGTKTNDLNIGYKIGLEFFYSKKGRSFLSKLKKKEIFLDLKLNDIPNTCVAALRSIKDLKNISYLTAHINGGADMLKAIKKESNKINKKIKILGVTVLTSFSNKSLKKIGHTKSVEELVKKKAALAKSTGLHGIVCSGQEVKYVKKICKKMEIITPGIRLAGHSKGDQKRTMSPKQAFRYGATALVMGRSLTKGSIKQNIQKLIKELK